MSRRVFAISAHPDDIEFMMAGTLILLGQAGFELHYMTVANGSCGSIELDAQTISAARCQEARSAAQQIGAVYHPPLVNDLEIMYDLAILRRVAAVIRLVQPEIILTHPVVDYMEDHSNTCRLVLTAAFARGMPNFATDPPTQPADQPVTIYHALPYGLHDPMRRRVIPDFYVDIGSVISLKREMLAEHRSQRAWLRSSQGIDSYLAAMDEMAAEVGKMSGCFAHAEGWTRHLHLGFCDPQADPLAEALGEKVNQAG
jgi:LmbE family N-acetylglucosaminyl deacetylase